MRFSGWRTFCVGSLAHSQLDKIQNRPVSVGTCNSPWVISGFILSYSSSVILYANPFTLELNITHYRLSVLDAKPTQSVSSGAMWAVDVTDPTCSGTLYSVG